DQHGLAEQFRRSGRNALFIVPEAPARKSQQVHWRDLGQLIGEVRRHLGLRRPWGPVVAVGHSGAYRTLLSWLTYPPLEHVIILDGLYGHEQPFHEWLEQARGQPNRLTIVAIDTLRWSEMLARDIGYTRALDWVPDDLSDDRQAIDDGMRTSRFVYIRSQHGHMELVTEGTTIPALLQMTRLSAVAGEG
ncbi:MAG: hypothetical protein AAGC55_13580, partial [Myxococcota bacterium]